MQALRAQTANSGQGVNSDLRRELRPGRDQRSTREKAAVRVESREEHATVFDILTRLSPVVAQVGTVERVRRGRS
jgi:hypothetical protein